MTIANNTNLRIDLVSIIGLIIFLMLFAFLIFAAIYVLRRIFQFANKKLDATGEIEKRRPRGITVIAGFNFLGGLSIFDIFRKSLEVPVIGIILKGHLANIYSLVVGIICIYLGIGFLKLQKLSWYIWTILYIFFILNNLGNIIFLSDATIISARTSLAILKATNIFALMFCIFLLQSVYTQRDKFNIKW